MTTVSFNVEQLRAASKTFEAEKFRAKSVAIKLPRLSVLCEESRFPPAYAPFIRMEAGRAAFVIADATQNAQHEARMLRWRAAFVLLTNGTPDRQAILDMTEAFVFINSPKADVGEAATLLDLAGLLFLSGAGDLADGTGALLDLIPKKFIPTLSKFSDAIGALSGLAAAAAVYRRGTATTESGRVAAAFMSGGANFATGKAQVPLKAGVLALDFVVGMAGAVTGIERLSCQVDGLVDARSESSVCQLESIILGTSRSADRYSAQAKSGEYGEIPRIREDKWWW